MDNKPSRKELLKELLVEVALALFFVFLVGRGLIAWLKGGPLEWELVAFTLLVFLFIPRTVKKVIKFRRESQKPVKGDVDE